LILVVLVVLLLGLFALGLAVQEFDSSLESALGILVAPGDGGSSGDFEAFVAQFAPHMHSCPGFYRRYQGDAETGVGPVHQIGRDDTGIPHAVPQFHTDHRGRSDATPRGPAPLISLGRAHRSLVLKYLPSAVPT